MSIESFSGVRFDSKEGLKQWLARHALRHRTYNVALLRKGMVPPALPLENGINKQWLMVHDVHHKFLNQFFVTGTTEKFSLTHDPMESEQAFYTWMRFHELLHQRIDQFLNATSH